MSVLLEIAVKTSALFALAFTGLLLLRSRSAALRHCVLAVTFVCAIAVPVFTVLPPAWYLPLPAAWLAIDRSTPVTISSEPARSPQGSTDSIGDRLAPPGRPLVSSARILFGMWLAGSLAAVIVFLAGLWHVRQIGRRAAPLESGSWREISDLIARTYGIRQPIELLHSTHPTMLVTWGLLRPRILLPSSASEWPPERIDVVLRHELAHIARGDWPMLIAATLLRALHWFNPLVWVGHRRMRQESEQACDDLVLASGVTPADYAAHLLAVARETVRRRHAWSAATAIAHPSTLEGRIRAMLNARLNRRPITAIARWTSGLVALTATLAIAGAGVSTFAAPADVLPSVASPLAASQPAQAADRAELANAKVVSRDASVPPVRMRIDAPAAAQSGPGVVAGVLYDQLGGLLPGASVALVQQPDGARYDTTTDRNGGFSFNLLPPGDYQLTTSLPGFATVTNLVNVASGQTIDRAVTMPIGTLHETISVVGGDGPSTSSNSRDNRAGRARPAPEPRTFFSGGIGGQIRVPVKLVHVNPAYPSTLQNASGIVLLEARVGIDGFLSDIRDVTGSRSTTSHQAFLASALDAVRQWEFRPTLLNNVPVETNIEIKIDYSTR